jgi:phage terminase small subunit
MRRSEAAHITGDPMVGLTDKQKLFLEGILRGMPQTTAARAAGYANPSMEANRQLKHPSMQEALQLMHRKHEKASHMTRKKVMDGMLEAIEMAKTQSEPGVMVAGWREIGRMCGYYAAEKKEISVSITSKRAVDKLETLSDAELLDMIEKDSEAIEGEFTEVIEATQAAADAHYEAAGIE